MHHRTVRRTWKRWTYLSRHERESWINMVDANEPLRADELALLGISEDDWQSLSKIQKDALYRQVEIRADGEARAARQAEIHEKHHQYAVERPSVSFLYPTFSHGAAQ